MASSPSVLARLRNPFSAWLDGAVLLILFAGINFLLEPRTPGWIDVHPNPYLLIPVLIGSRYGTAPGLYSAGAASVLLIGLVEFGEGIPDIELFLRGQSFLLLSFFVFGLVAGEMQSFFRRKSERLELLVNHSSEKMRILDRDIRNIARVNRELQERLLVIDNRTFAMDLEIRALYECPPWEIWQKALLVLNRTEEVACAAFYGPPDEGQMKRKGMIGGDSRLSESLSLSDSPLVREALERNEMVVLSDLLLPGKGEQEPFIFAKPILSEKGGRLGVLVVSRMPFLRFDPETLARIDLTADWIGEILDLRLSDGSEQKMIEGTENKRLLSESHFRRMVSLSVEAWNKLRVPSGLICISGKGVSREKLLQQVNRRVRAGDFLCQIEGTTPNAVVLLPFTSDRGADIFVESCRGMLSESLPDEEVVVESLPTELFASISTVWSELERRVREPSA